jgi:hypothetical protein
VSQYASYREIPALTADERRLWRAKGVVVPAWRLPTSVLLQLEDTTARLSVLHEFEQSDVLLDPHLPQDDEAQIEIAREFMDHLTHPDLIELVGDLAGPDLVLGGAVLHWGWPGRGCEAAWHQAGACWPVEATSVFSVYIALDDTLLPATGLSVRDGSMLAGSLAAQTGDSTWPPCTIAAPDSALANFTARPVPLEAGQLALLHGNLAQALVPTPEPGRHALLRVDYFTAEQHFERAKRLGLREFTTHPLWLVAGRSRCAENDFDLGHRIW